MDERKAFEAWARDNVGQPSFAGKHIRDGAWSYTHNFMDAHWRCWQAATAAERERRARIDAMIRNGPTRVTVNDEVRYSSDERQ